MTQKVIVLDPGHGSGPRKKWQGRGFDPGACFGDRTEAEAALEASFTLKHLLTERGFKVVMTHDGDDGPKPDLSWRVRMAAGLGAAALVSVHYDMAFTPPRHRRGVYAAPGAASWRLALALAGCMGNGWCEPTSSSRFRGLYIDAFPDARPSVMLELDSIQYAPPTGEAGKARRLAMLTPIADVLAEHLK